MTKTYELSKSSHFFFHLLTFFCQWSTNLNFAITELPSNILDCTPRRYDRELVRNIKVHSGFLSAFQTVQMGLLRFINGVSEGKKLYICGHSLGGALAVVNFLYLLLQPKPSVVHGVYTFGPPKVGNPALGEFLTRHASCKLQRVCNRGDLVPWLPPKRPYGFTTCGTLILIKMSGEVLHAPSEKDLNALRLQRLTRFKPGIDHRIGNYVCYAIFYLTTTEIWS